MIEPFAFHALSVPSAFAAAIVLFLLELALKSALLLGPALLLVRSLRRLSSEERHLIVASALFALLLLPFLSALAPNLELPVEFSTIAGTEPRRDIGAFGDAQPGATDAGERHTAAIGARGNTAARDERTSSASSRAVRSSPSIVPGATLPRRLLSNTALVVAGVYGLGAVSLLAYFMLSALRAHRAVRSMMPFRDESTLALVEVKRTELGIGRVVKVAAGASGHTPWAWGVLRPVIVLPPSFIEWPDEQRHNAVVHELAHIKRFDLLSLLVACTCCALYWFQPLAWLALRRMTREAENACDDRVLLEGMSNTAYAKQLLEIANTIYSAAPLSRSSAAPLVMAMARPSIVAQRIRSILDPEIRRSPVSKSKAVLTWIASLAVIGLIGPLATLQSQEPPEAEPASRLGDPELQRLLSAGPTNSLELERLVRMLAENDRDAEAVSVLADYLARQSPSAARCNFCVELLLTEGTPLRGELHTLLQAAFDTLEDRAYATNNGDLLVRLAEISVESTNRAVVTRGAWYLFEALRIGNTAKPDQVKMLAVKALSHLGRLDEAKGLATELHEDPSSSYYQSAATQGWIRYFETEMARESAISTRLLAVDEPLDATEHEYLPIYKISPRYPEEAAKQGMEGHVIVEFTVDTRGKTEDLTVVESTDPVFEQAALEAVSKFLYMPRIENGIPIDVPGVRNKITFVVDPGG